MMRKKTERGFAFYEFQDRYDCQCSIQKSSLATEDAIWFGINDPDPKIMASMVMDNGVGWVKYPIHPDVLIKTQMHLTVDQVRDLLPILQKFVETGDI